MPVAAATSNTQTQKLLKMRAICLTSVHLSQWLKLSGISLSASVISWISRVLQTHLAVRPLAMTVPLAYSTRLVEQLLQSIIGDPSQIMDLGCGTGFHSIQLQQRYPKAQVLGVDISAGMLAYAKARYIDQPMRWLCGDAEDLDVACKSQSLIFSNFALQWCECLDTLATELYRVLRPGGQLVLAIPGPATLAELRHAWAQVNSAIHVNRFASLAHWQQALVDAGFTRIDLHSDTVTEEHSSVRELLLELKNVGAHNNNAGRPTTMTGKQQLKALYNAYEPYRLANGALPATWEIISGTVVKA